jgi:hypothetical protein
MRATELTVRPRLLFSVVASLSFCIIACKKQVATTDEVPQAVKEKIFALGFSTDNIQKIEEGYLAEGDIVLSDAELDRKPETQFLRIAGNEQYRTYNLLTRLPRTVTISLSNKFSFVYAAALDEAIRRYNAEKLQIHFQRANTNADIEIVRASGNWIATSGLPSSTGTLCRTIKLNPWVIGSGNNTSTFINYVATLIAHELGHCIGFRHTDYMNRSFSCTGHSVNEGAGDAGAVNIPGTPASSDRGSWMLACIAANQNRPFNDNDKVALQYLY